MIKKKYDMATFHVPVAMATTVKRRIFMKNDFFAKEN